MDLDARLQKLDAGDAVKSAARAFIAAGKGASSADERSLADEFKAIIETMVLLAAIDGFVTDDELAQLRSSVEKMIAPDAIGAGLEELLAASLERLTADGWQARVEDVASRIKSPASRLLAFRLGAAVAFVDDDVDEAEAQAIEALATAFGISSEDSQAILREVVEDLFG
jgi:hypothetical protein